MTTPPWVSAVNSVPTAQSGYPRTVSVYRLKTVAGGSDAIGNVGYSGAEAQTSSPEGPVLIISGLFASIQLAAAGKVTKNVGLPGDSTSKPTWNVFIPSVPLYTIRDRDILQDDEGYRYEVNANEWLATIAGYKLSTVREEA